MEDYHVDRPGVEVRRRMKLTGTNNPIGLIVSQQNSFDLTCRNHRQYLLIHVCRVDLVALSEVPHPIPFRTRSLSPPEPMVLRLKARESRSPPGLQGGQPNMTNTILALSAFGLLEGGTRSNRSSLTPLRSPRDGAAR